MAEPIQYRPPSAETRESARQELERLLQVLADSGTLRALTDLIARAGQVADVLTAQLDSQPGRNALGNLALALTTLTELPPEKAKQALGATLRAARQAGARRAPGVLRLLLLARRANVRRATWLVLTALDTLGGLLDAAPGSALARRPGSAAGGAPAVPRPAPVSSAARRPRYSQAQRA